jgi:hypothetical protein
LDSVKKNSISSTEWESLLHYLKSLKNFWTLNYKEYNEQMVKEMKVMAAFCVA